MKAPMSSIGDAITKAGLIRDDPRNEFEKTENELISHIASKIDMDCVGVLIKLVSHYRCELTNCYVMQVRVASENESSHAR